MNKFQRIPQPRNNQILLNEIKSEYSSQLKQMQQLIASPTKKILNNLSHLHSLISHLLCQWALLQLTPQNLTSLSLQHFQNPHHSPHNKQPSLLPSQLISFDFSIKCQISGTTSLNPSRTTKCKFVCVVDKKVLQQCGVCSCGKQIEKFENQVVEDWVLGWVGRYYRWLVGIKEGDIFEGQDKEKKQLLSGLLMEKNKKWNGLIRVHIDKRHFQFFNDNQFSF